MRARPDRPPARGSRRYAPAIAGAALFAAVFVPAAPAHAALEDLQVTPVSGPPGTQLTISGRCTDVGSVGATVVGPPIVPLVSLALSLGTWSTTATVPAGAAPGAVEITARCVSISAAAATTTFTVTSAPATTTTTPPPSPTTSPPAAPPAGATTTISPASPSNPAPGSTDGGGTDDGPGTTQPAPGSPGSAPAAGSPGRGGGDGGGTVGTDDPEVNGDGGGEALDPDAGVAVQAAELREPALSAGGGPSGGGRGWLWWMLIALVVGAVGGAAVWYRFVRPDDAEVAGSD